MPCYQVNTVSVDFQAGDLALLQKAAASLSLVVVDDGSGRVIRDRNGTVATYVAGLDRDGSVFRMSSSSWCISSPAAPAKPSPPREHHHHHHHGQQHHEHQHWPSVGLGC